MNRNTVFVVGGSPEAKRPHRHAPRSQDRVIAADRGAHHARAWGWPVHLLVGDLDSLSASDANQELSAGTPIVRVAAAKDQTDLELALAFALDEAPDAIVICAALGGRTDHLLANVLLLTRPELKGRDICLVDGAETVRILGSGGSTQTQPAALEILGRAGDILTLLPVHGDAEGVTTSGLSYPLKAETLYAGQARGISNIFTGERATITLGKGLLLTLHISQEHKG